MRIVSELKDIVVGTYHHVLGAIETGPGRMEEDRDDFLETIENARTTRQRLNAELDRFDELSSEMKRDKWVHHNGH